MTHQFFDNDFLVATGIGLAGVLVWLLKTYNRPDNDSLWAALAGVFGGHSLSVFFAIVAYFGACMILHEMNQLNPAAAFGAGFMGQSFSAEIIGRRAKRLNGNGEHKEG